jgi:hypothetical protein
VPIVSGRGKYREIHLASGLCLVEVAAVGTCACSPLATMEAAVTFSVKVVVISARWSVDGVENGRARTTSGSSITIDEGREEG